MTRQDSTPKPENTKNRAKDAERQKSCQDERLSDKAGYGRTTNNPNKTDAER